MSKLGKLLGHPETVEIGGETLTLYPLKVKDLKLFEGLDKKSTEEQMKVNNEIIKKTLKDDVPTDEEIEELSQEFFLDLMDAIIRLNFKDEKIAKIERIRELKEKALQQKK